MQMVMCAMMGEKLALAAYKWLGIYFADCWRQMAAAYDDSQAQKHVSGTCMCVHACAATMISHHVGV
jgi:hypothetical protein